VKKPPSKLKKILRELQLILSVGAAMLIVYALITSSLAMRLSFPQMHSRAGQELLGALLAVGPLLLVAPAICFAMRLFIELSPWRLGLGTVAFVEAALLLLRWDTGELESSNFDLGSGAQLSLVVLAGVLSALAARSAAKRMGAREAASPPPLPAPAADLAEQMRQAEQAAHDSAKSKS
jgi:hypothetical protein